MLSWRRILTHVELLAPDEKSGVLEGVVIDKGEKWIDIDDEEERYRLVPKWIDGPEKRAVELIAKTPKKPTFKSLGSLMSATDSLRSRF